MKKNPTVFMFAGQGSQYFQMGRPLFDSEPVFRDSMLALDRIAGEYCEFSVVEALYSNSARRGVQFSQTILAHASIFMVQYSLAKMLVSSGVRPDLTLGVSAGSFAAAAVAGFMPPEVALIAAVRQAKALEECCEPGGMIAVLENPNFYDNDFIRERSELAAINFSAHFVVAAREPQLAAIEAELRSRNIVHQRLAATFAFHSRWIDAARGSIESYMASIKYAKGQLPMMCCDRTDLLSEMPESYFWGVARRPIRFREALLRLEGTGPYRYVDIGPSTTLSTFMKYLLPTASLSSFHPIQCPYGRDLHNVAALVN